MTYTLTMTRRAQKQLARLPGGAYERVRDAIRRLAADPRPLGCLKLTGRDGWRVRVGDYRVIYEIEDSQHVVTVVDVGHRREVYR